MQKIIIYHTNDIHSNYDFLKKVHTYMKANKSENDLYLDSGDFTDLKDLVVQADMGNSAMELMMSCGLDMMAVGNNEMDLGYDAITSLSEKYPISSANVTDNDDRKIPKLSGYRIIEDMGKKFLIIAISPFYSVEMKDAGYNVFTTMNNLKSHAPEKYVNRILEDCKGKYDFCILLSHSGLVVEEELLKNMPEVDLCLGGHSHRVETHRGYSQSGQGQYLGKVTLEIDDEDISIVKNEQIDLQDREDIEFDSLLESKRQTADEILSRELPVIGKLEFDQFSESRLINFICDCLHKKFGGDLALMHAGIAEASLTRPVSRKSLINNFPSKLNPTIMDVSGENIKKAVLLSLDEDYIHQDGHGPGFRGKVLGTLGFSANVRIETEPFSMKIDGAEIEDEKMYTVITDDYLQRGTGYPTLQVPNEKSRYHIWFIRDLVEHYLMDEEVFELSRQMRKYEK